MHQVFVQIFSWFVQQEGQEDEEIALISGGTDHQWNVMLEFAL